MTPSVAAIAIKNAQLYSEIKDLFEARGFKGTDGYTKLFEHGYKGRKNKKGFYVYDVPKKKGLPFLSGKKKASVGRSFEALA